MNPQEILVRAQDALTARRVFGDPFQTDGVTVLPVAFVAGGGRGGKGAAAEEGGVGFGLWGKPAGVLVIKDGDARWRPAIDVNRVTLGGQLIAITAILSLRPILVKWRHLPSGNKRQFICTSQID
jgi:uncharacterized spore protein YtfJ